MKKKQPIGFALLLISLACSCAFSNRNEIPFEYEETPLISSTLRNNIRDGILAKDFSTLVSSNGSIYSGNIAFLRSRYPDFSMFSHYRMITVETETAVNYHLVFWLTSDEQILKVESFEGYQGKFTQGAEFLWRKSFLLSPKDALLYLQSKLNEHTAEFRIAKVFIANPSDAYPGPNEIFTWFYRLTSSSPSRNSGTETREFFVFPYFCPADSGEPVSEINAYLWYLQKRVYRKDLTDHLVPVF